MVKTRKTTPKAASAAKLPSVATPPPAGSTYRKGDRVQHRQFGEGTVIALEPGKLSICFDKPVGTKLVIESFVKPS